MRFQILSILALPLAASASALPLDLITNVLSDSSLISYCKLNSIIIDALQLRAPAVSFCSKFLSISTQTVTTAVVVTPVPVTNTAAVTVTAAPVTNTVTQFQTTAIAQTVVKTQIQAVNVTATVTTSTATITCMTSARFVPTALPADPALPAAQLNERGGLIIAQFPDGWPESDISSACKCLRIPTPTRTITQFRTLSPQTVSVTVTRRITPTVDVTRTVVVTATNTVVSTQTVTSTFTVTVGAVATTIIPNGLTYREWDYQAGPGGVFVTNPYRGTTPRTSGTLQSLSFASPSWPNGGNTLTLSDGNVFTNGLTTIILNGFFIAKETGQYTFSTDANRIDNYGWLWLGLSAYSWLDATTVYKSSRTTTAAYVGGFYQITLNQGDVIPITWLWANEGGPAQSQVSLTTPGGRRIEGATDYFIKACNPNIFR